VIRLRTTALYCLSDQALGGFRVRSFGALIAKHKTTLRCGGRSQFKLFDTKFIARAVDLSCARQFPEAAMSKKRDRLRDKAEELRANADNIGAEECHRISLELAEMAEELADQWDALAVTMVSYLADRAAAK
jgi:hypothetical protein